MALNLTKKQYETEKTRPIETAEAQEEILAEVQDLPAEVVRLLGMLHIMLSFRQRQKQGHAKKRSVSEENRSVLPKTHMIGIWRRLMMHITSVESF